MDDAWTCVGSGRLGTCASGVTGFYQTSDICRHACNVCDYDMCEGCGFADALCRAAVDKRGTCVHVPKADAEKFRGVHNERARELKLLKQKVCGAREWPSRRRGLNAQWERDDTIRAEKTKGCLKLRDLMGARREEVALLLADIGKLNVQLRLSSEREDQLLKGQGEDMRPALLAEGRRRPTREKADGENAPADLAEAEKTRLQKALARCEKEAEEREASLTQLRRENAWLEGALTRCQGQAEKHRSENDGLEATTATLRAEVDRLRDELLRCRQQVEAPRDDAEKRELRRQVEALQHRASAADDEARAAQAAQAAAEENVARQARQRSEERAQLEQEAAMLEAVLSENDQLKGELAHHKDQSSHLSNLDLDEHRRLQGQNEQLLQLQQQLQEDVAAMQQERDQLKRQMVEDGLLEVPAGVTDIGLTTKTRQADGRVFVETVTPGTWAAENGIRADAEVVNINHRPAAWMSKDLMRNAIRERPLYLRIQRPELAAGRGPTPNTGIQRHTLFDGELQTGSDLSPSRALPRASAPAGGCGSGRWAMFNRSDISVESVRRPKGARASLEPPPAGMTGSAGGCASSGAASGQPDAGGSNGGGGFEQQQASLASTSAGPAGPAGPAGGYGGGGDLPSGAASGIHYTQPVPLDYIQADATDSAGGCGDSRASTIDPLNQPDRSLLDPQQAQALFVPADGGDASGGAGPASGDGDGRASASSAFGQESLQEPASVPTDVAGGCNAARPDAWSHPGGQQIAAGQPAQATQHSAAAGPTQRNAAAANWRNAMTHTGAAGAFRALVGPTRGAIADPRDGLNPLDRFYLHLDPSVPPA